MPCTPTRLAAATLVAGPLLLPAAARASASLPPLSSPLDVPVSAIWTEAPDEVRTAAAALREACAGWSPRVPRPSAVDTLRPGRGEPPEAVVCETALDPLGRKDASSALAAGALLAAAAAGVAWGACATARGLIGLPRDALRRSLARRRDRRLAARHEAAHALVATVLDMPFEHARVFPRWSACGVGGYVRFDSASSPDASCGEPSLFRLLVRRTAMLVAGVAGERADVPFGDLTRRLEIQSDWPRALEASWIAEAMRPGRRVLELVVEEVAAALRAPAWQAAIQEAAKVLLRARGGEVPPQAFAAVARRFGLALPEVEALAAGMRRAGPAPRGADAPRAAGGAADDRTGCVIAPSHSRPVGFRCPRR